MRLAKYLAHAGVASRRAAEQLDRRRARDGRRRGRHATRRATSTSATPIAVDGQPVEPDGRARVVYVAQQAAPASSRPRTTPHGRPTVVDLVPAARAAVPGRAPRRRHHRPDPADQRRRARPPAHAPALRGPAHLPRAASAAPPVREPALRALREGVELEDGRTAPAQVRRLAPDRARADDPRGPQAPGAAHVRGGRPSGARARARRASARCGSAGWRRASTARLTPRRGRARCGAL